MKITLLCVGKVKEKFYWDAISEYGKRLSRYCNLEIVEVADEKTKEQATEKEIQLVREKEGERLLARIREDSYVICLAIQGKERDSEGLAEHLHSLMVSGKSQICFVIGGSLGLSPQVIERADETLSFSKMTFPHQLMRVILLEQIYRSYRIINHEPYHK